MLLLLIDAQQEEPNNIVLVVITVVGICRDAGLGAEATNQPTNQPEAAAAVATVGSAKVSTRYIKPAVRYGSAVNALEPATATVVTSGQGTDYR